MAQQSPSGPVPPHCRGFTIALTHTALGRTPLDKLTARHRDLYLTALITYKRHIHAPSGIRTRNLSKRAATESRLRQHGHWDSRWLLAKIILLNLHVNFRLQLPDKCGPAKRSRYSDLLPAGRSED